MNAPADREHARILVVDDEESIRVFVEKALVDGERYQVALAADGPEALTIAQQQGPFDLFVIDLVMPRMSGEEVVRSVRRSDPDAKVLYFTGYSGRLFKETLTLSANEAFLDKPATIKGLREAVSLLLFGHI